MDFLRARTTEQIQNRQNEIMQACDALFDKSGYDGVSIKAISEITSISRASIYTYYRTKDEILLDLLDIELVRWKVELEQMTKKYNTLSREEYCQILTSMLKDKHKMLRLYSYLFTLLEINCRMEKLIGFKKNAVPGVSSMAIGLMTFFPELTQEKAYMLTEEILSYVLGLYPMSHLTDKQLKAIELSDTGYRAPDFDKLCYEGIRAILYC